MGPDVSSSQAPASEVHKHIPWVCFICPPISHCYEPLSCHICLPQDKFCARSNQNDDPDAQNQFLEKVLVMGWAIRIIINTCYFPFESDHFYGKTDKSSEKPWRLLGCCNTSSEDWRVEAEIEVWEMEGRRCRGPHHALFWRWGIKIIIIRKWLRMSLT